MALNLSALTGKVNTSALKDPKRLDQFGLPKSEISQGTVSPSNQFIQTLPAPVRGFANAVKEGIFGSGQGVDLAGNEKIDTGALGFFRPLGIGKTDYERFVERQDSLVEKGVDREKAGLIASYYTKGNSTGNPVADMKQREIQTKAQKLAETELTREQKGALTKVAFFEGLDNVFGALDVVSAGTLKPLGRAAAERIAKSRVFEDIAGLLIKENPTLTKNDADIFGKALVPVENADDVQSVMNKISFGLQEARKGGAVNTSALQTPQTGVARATPTPIQPVAPSLALTAQTVDPLVAEARKYSSAEEFIQAGKPSVKADGRTTVDSVEVKNLIEAKQDAFTKANIENPNFTKTAETVIKTGNKEEIEKLFRVYSKKQEYVMRQVGRDLPEGFNKGVNNPKYEIVKQYKATDPVAFSIARDNYVTTQLTAQYNKAQRPSLQKIFTPEGRVLVRDGKQVFPRETSPLPVPGKPQQIPQSIPPASVKPVQDGSLDKTVLQETKKVKTPQERVAKRFGSTEKIIESLRNNDVLEKEINDLVLEDGTKLVDTVKVKREKNGVLSAVITKQQLKDVETNYKGTLPSGKWVKRSVIKDAIKFPGKIASIYEVPQVYFERIGLKELIYDPMRQAQRGAGQELTNFVRRFENAGLAKKGGWFTADRFTISKKESQNIGKYILTRQGKGYDVSFESLTPKEQKFVETFDGIIKETEPRFFEVAKKNGKEPGMVENYAPIMTRGDIELIDKGGDMDFIVRKHPAFFSTKERVENVPVELYETDYREVVARWLGAVTRFNAIGDVAPEVKYLIESEQFQSLVSKRDYQVIHDWFRSITTPDIPKTEAEEGVNFVSRLLRKSSAVASLGLNYASVAKQALTHVPLSIIDRAPPKLRSKFTEAFGIKTADLPSITERKGDIAIADLQGRIGRVFTGALTKFDQINAQKSLNRLLDKEYTKFLKAGKEVGPEQQAYILKTAQDRLDLWYGGMTAEQLPPAFRVEIGRFLNMFILPLTSQLNGFFQHILKAQGAGSKAGAIAQVFTSVAVIAYLEQVITNLSPEWSDEKQVATDVLQSMAGNIPIVSQIVYALASEKDVQISAGVSGISNLLGKISDFSKGNADIEDLGFAIAETAGLPKQIRRIREGMELVETGGVVDKEGKMMAPVTETDEQIRSFLRGKYGSLAAKDWVRNIGEKSESREWFVPQVEFLQNGDYERKAVLYQTFSEEERVQLRSYLSEGQLKKLDRELSGGNSKSSGSLEDIFGAPAGSKSLEEIFQ